MPCCRRFIGTLTENIDLYGNDDTEYAAPPEQQETLAKSEAQELPASVKTESPPPTKPAAVKPPSPAPPTKLERDLSPLDDEFANQPYQSTAGDSSGFSNQPTQQIPTYQDNESSEYREPPPNLADQNYAGAINRPVRPSEMKEEG